MKFNYKFNLGNIVGVVANIAPEVAGKIDASKLSDMVIEGSAEYTVQEVSQVYGLVRDIIKDLPEILEDLAEGALAFRAIDDAFSELNEQIRAEKECDEDCCHCGGDYRITATTRGGEEEEINIVQAMALAEEANQSLFNEVQEYKAANEELKRTVATLKKRLYGPKRPRVEK